MLGMCLFMGFAITIHNICLVCIMYPQEIIKFWYLWFQRELTLY